MTAIARCMRVVRHRVLRDSRGTAVVEFAIIFPVLAMLVFGVIDFGRAFFLRNNLVSAVREGARYGATLANPCNGAAQTLIQARVQTYVSSFGGASVTPTVDTSVGACSATSGVVTDVVVRITNYTFTPVTPVFRLISYNSALNITVSARYRWEASN
jgi:Flp pilus assembly protein TadG